MTIRIERVDAGAGEYRRRFFLIAEVTFMSRGEDDYYSDDDLPDCIEQWVDAGLNDRDDGPSIRFHEVPPILDVDVESIARGDYPKWNDWAAELSDRIRAAGATCVGGDYDGWQAAADLIDPRKP